MLASGVILGVKGLKTHYVKKLGISLMLAGGFMAGFSLFENIPVMCVFGFLFFAAIPFASNCLDYLIRTNIPDDVQGRAWGLIGFLSQLGYVVAYAVSGKTADMIGFATGRGVGRGAAAVILAAGILLVVTAASVLIPHSIKALEDQPL